MRRVLRRVPCHRAQIPARVGLPGACCDVFCLVCDRIHMPSINPVRLAVRALRAQAEPARVCRPAVDHRGVLCDGRGTVRAGCCVIDPFAVWDLRPVRDVGLGHEGRLALHAGAPSRIIRGRYRRPRERADVGAIVGQCDCQLRLVRELYRISLFRPCRHERIDGVVFLLEWRAPAADPHMDRGQDCLRIREELRRVDRDHFLRRCLADRHVYPLPGADLVLHVLAFVVILIPDLPRDREIRAGSLYGQPCGLKCRICHYAVLACSLNSFAKRIAQSSGFSAPFTVM